MKKLLNFLINLSIRILGFIILIFLILGIYTYIFSQRNNISLSDSASYIYSIVTDIFKQYTFKNEIPDSEVKIPTSVTDTNNNYYYQQLTDTAKTIYNSLENNIDNLKKDNYIIDFSTTFNDLLNESAGNYKLNRSYQSALDAFFYDHPELFYIDLTKLALNIRTVSLGPLKTYTVQISPSYSRNYLSSQFSSEQEVDYAISQVETIKNDIISMVSNESDLYYKIKKIHDTLVNSIRYETTLSKKNIHNIYGALIENEVVCEGYARSFKYILDSLNIECILVKGNATSPSGETELHMWNYVKLDNLWYGVDLTWDDPVVVGGNVKDLIRHDYFLKRHNTFAFSHEPDGKISNDGMLFALPTLSDNNYRY